MKRRPGIENSSLELLLDTICNTFGGIIFLAILVAILLQMSNSDTSDSVESATQQMMKDLQGRESTIAAELTRLRKMVEQQNQLIDKLPTAEDQAILEKVLRQRRTKSQLVSRRLESLGEINSLELKVGRIAQELAKLDAAKIAAQRRIDTLEKELKAETQRRTTETKLPFLRDTKKREVALVLVQGRLRVLPKPGTKLGFNTDEFDIVTNNDRLSSVRPKAGQGTPVLPNGQSRDALSARLVGFQKNQDYLAVFVWHDSFDKFRELQHVMVDRGFEYRLVPIPPGIETLRVGNDSGAARVQ